jgi:hypothetical protein
LLVFNPANPQMVEAWKKGRVCRRVICRGAADDSTERDAAVVRQHRKGSGSGETVGQQSMTYSGIKGSGSEDEQRASSSGNQSWGDQG